MTFKDIYEFVSKGGKAVVYSIVENKGDIRSPQFMSDYTISQDVVYSAEMKSEEDGMFALLGWDADVKTVYLYDERNNMIANGQPEATRGSHVFLTRDDALAELRQLMEDEAARWQRSALDADY